MGWTEGADDTSWQTLSKHLLCAGHCAQPVTHHSSPNSTRCFPGPKYTAQTRSQAGTQGSEGSDTTLSPLPLA